MTLPLSQLSIDRLSLRQREVLELAGSGCPPLQIAARLQLEVAVVCAEMEIIAAKMGVCDGAGLSALAARHPTLGERVLNEFDQDRLEKHLKNKRCLAV